MAAGLCGTHGIALGGVAVKVDGNEASSSIHMYGFAQRVVTMLACGVFMPCGPQRGSFSAVRLFCQGRSLVGKAEAARAANYSSPWVGPIVVAASKLAA